MGTPIQLLTLAALIGCVHPASPVGAGEQTLAASPGICSTEEPGLVRFVAKTGKFSFCAPTSAIVQWNMVVGLGDEAWYLPDDTAWFGVQTFTGASPSELPANWVIEADEEVMLDGSPARHVRAHSHERQASWFAMDRDHVTVDHAAEEHEVAHEFWWVGDGHTRIIIRMHQDASEAMRSLFARMVHTFQLR